MGTGKDEERCSLRMNLHWDRHLSRLSRLSLRLSLCFDVFFAVIAAEDCDAGYECRHREELRHDAISGNSLK